MKRLLLSITLSITAMTNMLPGQETVVESGLDVDHDSITKRFKTSQCSACHRQSRTPQWQITNSPYGTSFLLNADYMAETIDQSPFSIGLIRASLVTDPLIRSHLPLKDETAFLVVSGMDKEGSLQPGDIITQIDNLTVDNLQEIRKYAEADRTATVTAQIIRKGKKTKLSVTTAELARPEQPYRIGVQVEAPSDALSAQLNLYENEGLLVTGVVEDSPAAKAEIQVHDILLRAGKTRLSSIDDLRTAVNGIKGNEMDLLLMRAGNEVKVKTTPEQEPRNDDLAGLYLDGVSGGACPAMTPSVEYGPRDLLIMESVNPSVKGESEEE